MGRVFSEVNMGASSLKSFRSLAILALIFGLTCGVSGTKPPKGSWTKPDGWTPNPDWTPPSGGPNGGGSGGSGGSKGPPTAGPTTTSGPTTTAVIPDEQPVVPTACTDANAGRCECGDTSKGFQTYTFWLGDVQRCFTVFHPPTRASEALPVVLAPNCYAKDKLQGIEALNAKSDGNAAAVRFGFVRIGLSSPDGAWTFGNDGVVNDEKPMPCSEEDSKDIPYVQAVFDFIESNPDQFDASKIYAQGFSQNSMFSAYIGFSFSEKVLAIWQGGSGMAYTGQPPNLPGCQAHVKASVFAECDSCNECMEDFPCEECQYWPIYPCYSATKPMVDCLAVYDNDAIAVSVEDPDTYNSATYMYDKLVAEGHDARLFRFSKPDDETIGGGHSDPKNKEYWQVGCMGITAPCSDVCEAAFLDCVAEQGAVTASDNVDAFETCIDANVFNGLDECHEECAPTFAMLASSEMPTTFEFDNFGAGSDNAGDRPASSICEA